MASNKKQNHYKQGHFFTNNDYYLFMLLINNTQKIDICCSCEAKIVYIEVEIYNWTWILLGTSKFFNLGLGITPNAVFVFFILRGIGEVISYPINNNIKLLLYFFHVSSILSHDS